jgi:tetratricopeptide (TPR) repeat protein
MADVRPGGAADCIDAATLAAYVDGTLDSAGRGRVVAHLASCEDCYELVAEVVRTETELEERPSDDIVSLADHVAPHPAQPKPVFWSKPVRFATAGGLLAVAATALFFVIERGSALDQLVSVVGSERLTEARPTGGFRYGRLRSPTRGSGETNDLQLRIEAEQLRERASRTRAAEDVHASGIAQLLRGDVDNSIASLESAAQSKPNDAAYRADVGAAYMTRFLQQNNQADATAALDALDKAIALSPTTPAREAWFNKALLLERLNRRDEALNAWNRYIALPDESGWRDEGIRHRDALQQPTGR